MILDLFGLTLCCYVGQLGVEKPHGLLNCQKIMKNCVPIHLKDSFGFMVLNNQIFLKLSKKFRPHVNVNLSKVS